MKAKCEKVLVIIVTFNADQWIERCFKSVLSSTCQPDIYVVDNGSQDNTLEYLHSLESEKLFIYESGVNLGFGKANNIGLTYAINKDYDYVYLLNQDAWIFPNTIEELIKIQKNTPEYGIISPLQMNCDLKHIDGNLLKHISNSKMKYEFIENYLTDCTCNDIYPIPFVMAAHWLISRKCFCSVGGFSPTFRHYGEDDNYICRAIYKGFNVGIAPKLKVVHDRACRKTDMNRTIFMHYVYTLVMLSQIEKPAGFLFIFYQFFTICLRYHNFLYTKYFFQLLKNYKLIVKNRKKSIEEHAFLTC